MHPVRRLDTVSRKAPPLKNSDDNDNENIAPVLDAQALALINQRINHTIEYHVAPAIQARAFEDPHVVDEIPPADLKNRHRRRRKADTDPHYVGSAFQCQIEILLARSVKYIDAVEPNICYDHERSAANLKQLQYDSLKARIASFGVYKSNTSR